MPEEKKMGSQELMEFIGGLDAGTVDYRKVWKPAACTQSGFILCASRLDAEENGVPGSEKWQGPPSTRHK